MNFTALLCSPWPCFPGAAAWAGQPVPTRSMQMAGGHRDTCGVLVGSRQLASSRHPRIPAPALWMPTELGFKCWGHRLFVCTLPSETCLTLLRRSPTSQSHTVLLTEAFPSRCIQRVLWGTRPSQPQAPCPLASFASKSIPLSLPVEETRMCPSCCPCSPQTGESSHKSCFILWTNKC